MITVVVLVADKYHWLLKPFSYLFNVYWSTKQDVIVAGFKRPDFPLPDNFRFHSIAPSEYPVERWSDALIRLLQSNVITDSHFVLLLEDYLLCRTADVRGIASLTDYMRGHKDILRMDLTADRLYGHMMKDIEPWGHYDIITTPDDAPYQMSLQAGIWNRSHLLSIMKPNRTPWEVEIYTNLTGTDLRVCGTRQWPLRYSNLLLKGEVQDYELERIDEYHRNVISQWIER